jgi:TonB family protein
MRAMRVLRSALLVFSFITSGGASPNDLDRELQKYKGSVWVLRNFYGGDRLRFNSDGHIVGNAVPGMWTVDGVISVSSIRFTKHELEIKGRRAFVARGQGGFDLAASGRTATIDVDLDPQRTTPAEINSVLMNVFLSQHDRFSDFVPDYWKSCIRPHDPAEKGPNCHLAPQLAVLVGSSNARIDAAPSVNSASDSVENPRLLFKVGQGVTPPRTLNPADPRYSELARAEHVEGIVVLTLIVDQTGSPRDIVIASPVGYGLDEEAVAAVRKWRFDPARKDGEPVSVLINVEVQFRLR